MEDYASRHRTPSKHLKVRVVFIPVGRDKLLQDAERVWHVSGGTEDERIDAAITHTRAFFESVGIPTRLSAYGLGREAVDAVVAQLTAHGMLKLGEHRSITPEISRAILEAAL